MLGLVSRDRLFGPQCYFIPVHAIKQSRGAYDKCKAVRGSSEVIGVGESTDGSCDPPGCTLQILFESFARRNFCTEPELLTSRDILDVATQQPGWAAHQRDRAIHPPSATRPALDRLVPHNHHLVRYALPLVHLFKLTLFTGHPVPAPPPRTESASATLSVHVQLGRPERRRSIFGAHWTGPCLPPTVGGGAPLPPHLCYRAGAPSPFPTPHTSPPTTLPTVEPVPSRLVDSLLHSVSTHHPRSPTASTIASGGQFNVTAAGLSPPRQAQGRMRSSIACIRCRRSKVKCVNNGVGTACRSCENSGRECSYPSPIAGVTRRRDSLSGKQDGVLDGERRQRPRKSAHTFMAHPLSTTADSPRPLLDALDPRVLTPAVWQELFDIFQVHYSADLPFLHSPTFLRPLRQASMQPPSTASVASPPATARPPGSPEFLLAFLALTARFHPRLVARHSPSTAQRASNPLIASEYYSAAAHERMALMWSDNRVPQAIEWIQAALMLGLHEWGMCRGSKAWLTIGSAIRAAQAMGLQYELELDDEPMSRSLALISEAERLGVESNQGGSVASVRVEEDIFVQQEVRRRTFWSCFIMDRYLSSGKYRPQMLHARELRIQLPASERSFLFAEKVRTLMLGEEEHQVARAEVQSHRQASVALAKGDTPEPHPASSLNGTMGNEEDKGRLESGADEGLVSHYIKILEIYGRVVQWSCAGGRRIEEHPPWDSRCEWNKLRRQCLEFKASLPRQHTLTPQNTQAHISLKTSTPYTLVHTVYLLCQIMLHREYVPFIPLRCAKPEGPLDPPRFPADQYDIPAGFWEESAHECFKAARDIMDLVRSCEEWNALVETPIVGFAIYTVAFVGVYCINFPWMDPNGYMCTNSTASQVEAKKSGESPGFIAAKKALEMIGHMRLRLNMATGWVSTINRMHKYFVRLKKEYRKNIAASSHSNCDSDGSPLSTRPLSLREGGEGGGLDEFKLIERTLKEFGALEDQDVEMTDADLRPSSRAADALYDDSSAGTTVKSEEQEPRPAPAEPPKTDGGPWNAINAIPGATSSRQPSISTPTSGQFRTYDSYSHHPQQPQQASQHRSYAHQMNNFRPAHAGETPAAPPSLTSPVSQTTSSSSQSSPPFERQPSAYGGWTAQNNTYPMAPPSQQAAYSNGILHQTLPHPQTLPPMHSPYSTQHASSLPLQFSQQQSLQAPSDLHEPHQVWDAFQKEQWLNNLQTRMSADDLAAFVDGGDIADWATRGQDQAGWLTAVWNHGVNG